MLRTKFPAKVREQRRAEGYDPDIRPTQEWLRDHGYSGIEGFARRNNMSVSEVLEDICGFEPPPEKPLNIDHVETRQSVEAWLEKESDVFHQWGDARVQDARTHFRTLAKVAYDELGSTNLLRLLRADSPADTDLIIRLFSGLDSHVKTQGAQSNYTRSLEKWADYLEIREEVENHKVGKIREQMGYTFERKSPEHNLKPKQIRKCWHATESLEEKALLIILAAAGTRRSEPTDTEVSQMRLDQDDPHILFDDDRKTDAATVPIMAGAEVIEAWIEEIKTKDHWDGKWLFPSKKSRDGSRSSGWVNNTIERIVKRASVTFPDGEEPTPKSFRSFWYDHYADARQAWLDSLKSLADEQGVSSAKIIDLHYMTDKGERDHFRKFAQSYFSAAFGEELVHGYDGVREAREEERDEYVQKAIDDYMDDLRVELPDANSDEEDDETHKSPVADPVSAWTHARLRIEHKAAAASDTLENYPPSPKQTAAIGVGLFCWAAFFGVIWGAKGLFYIDPIAGTITTTPGTIIGLALGFALIVADVPDLGESDAHTESI